MLSSAAIWISFVGLVVAEDACSQSYIQSLLDLTTRPYVVDLCSRFVENETTTNVYLTTTTSTIASGLITFSGPTVTATSLVRGCSGYKSTLYEVMNCID